MPSRAGQNRIENWSRALINSSNNSTPDSFQAIQYQFTAHLRDPDNVPAPADVEDRRMAIYRDLLYRNVESFLSNAFPVLRKLYDDVRWDAMIRDYFKHHQAHTPLFPKMPQEFLQYLQQEREAPADPPFIWELAHYEWVEAALYLDSREVQTSGIDAQGDLLAGVPVLNRLIWLLRYRYPVHQISPDYMPCEQPEEDTYLVVYRNRQDEVGFLELNTITARLLDGLADTDDTGRAILAQIAEEIHHPDPEVVIAGGRQTLHDLHRRQIVLGTRAEA